MALWLSSGKGGRLELIFHDLMHVVLLGIGKDLIASFLADEVDSLLVVEERSAHLKQAFLDYCSWLRQRGISTSAKPFTMQSIGRESKRHFPELQSYYKAVEIKLLIFYFADRYQYVGAHASETEQLRAMAAYSLADFLHMTDTCSRLLTVEQRVFECTTSGSTASFLDPPTQATPLCF